MAFHSDSVSIVIACIPVVISDQGTVEAKPCRVPPKEPSSYSSSHAVKNRQQSLLVGIKDQVPAMDTLCVL